MGKIKKINSLNFTPAFYLEKEIKPELNVRRHRRRVSFKVTPKTENYLGFYLQTRKKQSKKRDVMLRCKINKQTLLCI